MPVAGRGKAGGILFSNSGSGIEKSVERLLGMNMKGITVKSVWIEEKIQIQKELKYIHSSILIL